MLPSLDQRPFNRRTVLEPATFFHVITHQCVYVALHLSYCLLSLCCHVDVVAIQLAAVLAVVVAMQGRRTVARGSLRHRDVRQLQQPREAPAFGASSLGAHSFRGQASSLAEQSFKNSSLRGYLGPGTFRTV